MGKLPCSVAGCDRVSVAKTWCDRHYRIAKRNGGDPLAPPRLSGWRAVCAETPCDRPVKRDGRCEPHAVRAERGLPPDATTRQLRGGLEETCRHPTCDDSRVSGGYCDKHYRRVKLHGDPDVVLVGGNPASGPCRIDGCDGQVVGWGYCYRHWRKDRLYGDAEFELPRVTWWREDVADHCVLALRDTEGVEHRILHDHADRELLDGRRWYVSSFGYAVSPRPQGQGVDVLARLLMGLERGDERIVDHANGTRLDNRRANLRVTSTLRNLQNQAIVNGRGTSKYRGVHYDRTRSAWQATVKAGRRVHHIGRYPSEDEAAAAVARFREEHDIWPGY